MYTIRNLNPPLLTVVFVTDPITTISTNRDNKTIYPLTDGELLCSHRSDGSGLTKICWKVWEGCASTLTDTVISKALNTVERKRYSLIHIRVSEARGKHTITICGRKRLRLRDHFGTIDHIASVLSEDSELGHGIPEGFRHPVLIVNI
jgi:hypothetical protein